MVKIIFSQLFITKLDNACDFYESIDPDYVETLIKSIYSEVQILKEFPRIGRILPEENVETIRELFVQKYRVIYEIVGENINIIDLHHFKQKFKLY